MAIKIPNLNYGGRSFAPRQDEEERQPDTRKPAKQKVVDPQQAQSLFGGDESSDSPFDVTFDEGAVEKAQSDAQKAKGADLPESARQKMGAGGGSLAAVTPERQPGLTAPPAQEEPVQEEEPQGLFDDVTSIDARQERERQAFADELAARKAEEIQRTEARAGLGGMGLSGATSELVGDVARQAERAGDIAMADLGRRQQQETFDELRRQASIWAFEEEFGVDLNGDGSYGAPPEEEPVAEGEEGDATAAPTRRKGSASNPIKVKNRKSLPETAEEAKDETGDYMFTEDGERLFVDEDGKYYIAGRSR